MTINIIILIIGHSGRNINNFNMMKTQTAFTLLEVMVIVVLIAVLASVALPNFRAMILNNRITTKANELIASINYARGETITHTGQSFALRSIDTDWSKGWEIVQLDATSDPEIMKVFQYPNDQIFLSETNAQTQLTFLARGRVFSNNIPPYTFDICHPKHPYGRRIQVAPTGRASIKRCSVTVSDSEQDSCSCHD
jgi:Tfp pilus assembly protein FimT